MQEDKVSDAAHFVTLTYNNENVPLTKRFYMTLKKRDLQLFFKRLRKIHSKKFPYAKPIKYYAVGEYGSRTFRPHYHIILFNCLDIVCVEKAWRIADKPIGDIHVGYVEAASVGYVLKYISKDKKIPLHKNDDRFPEFSLMSKGIGANYINSFTKKWHIADLHNRMYVTTKDGKKVSMPRYYKERIYTETERKAIAYVYKANLQEKQLTDEEKRNLIQAHIALFEKLKKKTNDYGKI